MSQPQGAFVDWLVLQEAVTHFDDAWRRGPRPVIDDYLPPGGRLRHRLLVELVHIDLELRLKAGESVRVEQYLGCYPELAADSSETLKLFVTFQTFRTGPPFRQRNPPSGLRPKDGTSVNWPSSLTWQTSPSSATR